MKSSELSIKDFYCVFVHTEMNLIAFLGPSDCVNTQYAALCGAMLHILGKSMGQFGVLHKKTRISRRLVIMNQSQVNVVRPYHPFYGA